MVVNLEVIVHDGLIMIPSDALYRRSSQKCCWPPTGLFIRILMSQRTSFITDDPIKVRTFSMSPLAPVRKKISTEIHIGSSLCCVDKCHPSEE